MKCGLSVMKWKAEFLRAKRTEDLEKDVVSQNTKLLPHFLFRIFRKAADRWQICWRENLWKHGKNASEKRAYLEKPLLQNS